MTFDEATEAAVQAWMDEIGEKPPMDIARTRMAVDAADSCAVPQECRLLTGLATKLIYALHSVDADDDPEEGEVDHANWALVTATRIINATAKLASWSEREKCAEVAQREHASGASGNDIAEAIRRRLDHE